MRGSSFVSMLVGLLVAATARGDAVDDFVAAQMKQQRIPGLSLAVIKDGKIIKAQGYGFANLEHQVPAKPETVYQSGSVGKQFAATAVMMLIEDGKVGLDDPVSKHLTNAPAAWKDITVRHLLSHTAGIHNYGPIDLDFRKDFTEDELLQRIYK